MKAIPASGHEKILLVEDDAEVRMVARGVFGGIRLSNLGSFQWFGSLECLEDKRFTN